jgi:2-polyprenyl-3-methyl-5-hydroxy-6-metoxy-1,4-benzoquinol methylase
MTNEVSRSQIFEDYTNHHGQYNLANPTTMFPDFNLNIRALLPTDRNAPILDFGCGMGQFLTYLQAHGYHTATGIDLSRSQVEYCHSHGLTQAQLVDDSIAFLAVHQNHFAAIVALDVIEHIPKGGLIPLLKAIYGALKPGGIFIMRVPNIAAAIGPWTRYLDFTHELSFDQRSIQQVLNIAQFASIQILPSRTAYRRKWLGIGFEIVRSWLYALLKLVYFIQSPGSVNPTIFTINIYGVGAKPVLE